MRLMIASPLPADVDGFLERFGVADLLCAYGSTETPGPIVRVPGHELVPGAVGRQREGFECRLVDEFDREVERGQVGELIVRTELPWSQTGGYLDNPAATLNAWRNGWFHTGDLMRQDEAGNFFFHDRATDSLRRRGENISSFEVERELLAFETIVEAACVGVSSPDPGGDVEVKVFLVAQTGSSVDFGEILAELARRMPYYMVPRFFELVDELPKTVTGRVLKNQLREQAHSPATWDAIANGLRVGRAGLIDSSPATAGN